MDFYTDPDGVTAYERILTDLASRAALDGDRDAEIDYLDEIASFHGLSLDDEAPALEPRRDNQMGGATMRTIAARFWSKVDKTADCWEWTASRVPQGYGQFSVGDQMFRAHRSAYVLAHGTIPAGRHVLHHCDNRGCVRPDHLYLGDDAANMRDQVLRGRHRSTSSPTSYQRGADHWTHRLRITASLQPANQKGGQS